MTKHPWNSNPTRNEHDTRHKLEHEHEHESCSYLNARLYFKPTSPDIDDFSSILLSV